MRKSFNTLFLILLLVGPSIVLSCVRQPAAEEDKTLQVGSVQPTVSSKIDGFLIYLGSAEIN